MTPLALGQSARRTRMFSDTDSARFAALTGAPVPQDVVPEALINAMFSDLLGVDLPGRGTNYLKQETVFHRAVRPGETLTADVAITQLRPEKFLVDLETTCRSDTGDIVASGRALVYVKDVQGAFSTPETA
ncbi:phosphate acetyltransferase [Maricaulis sp. D1M11]|uniref:phosphate acetyltransferase n=1 Tax=Maricaulis sp. D1M11 TaxID=3076117 RepID=UPI0039B5FFB8